MKIPRKINIAGYDITVKYGKKVFVNKEECFGFYDTESKQIVLAKGMSPARKREIFLHEFLHAIEDIYRISISEEGISCFAIGLAQLFSHNNVEI
jgi:Zn-dependent peptidase ImmA (M78 family)